MRAMTDSEVAYYESDPNITLKIGGKPLRCKCGCNVFHHPGIDLDIYRCNSCTWTFEAE
jgi:uncharacterized Zn-finger protein